jgi:hypothetical protein
LTVWFSTGWNLLALLPVSDVIDGFTELASYFETHYFTGERGTEGLKGAQLNPYFPYNFGTSISGHITIHQKKIQ